MKILETERLYLREFDVSDAKYFFDLNEDFDVIKYTGDKSFVSFQEAEKFIKLYNHYKEYQFGRWAVIRKSDSQFLGWCGLKFSPKKNEVDIGFRFFKKYWNQGFATESAKACLKFGFEKFNFKRIVGRVMFDNKSSIKVLEKIGLVFEKEFDFDGNLGLIYSIKNNN